MSERAVWLETSNAFVATGGILGASMLGPQQREGGHLVTAGAQHWIITVGDVMYQAGNVDGFNWAEGSPANTSKVQAGRTQSGTTTKSDEDIAQYIALWNSDGGGAYAYNLLSNSCQTFATHLVRYLCDGQGKLPNQGGISMTKDSKNFNAAIGFGEVACASAGGAKAAVSGPAAGLQGIKGQGAFFTAEMFKAEAGTDTPLGHVGVQWGPNANTGVGVRNGNAEATVLGFGGKVGKDGVGVRTPLGGADCCLM